MADKLPFSAIPSNATGTFEPYTVAIPENKLKSLHTLLDTCPIANETYESMLEDGELGVNHTWLTNSVKHWQSNFNWRKHEEHINSFPHYHTVVIDSDNREYRIHFVALFSQKPNAIPLLLLHGWPGSFLEFLPMLDILRKRHSQEDLPYHLVVLSLPGYMFSSPPPLDRDFRVEDIARVLHKLALSLGFGDGFIVQGGDIGSKVGRVIAAKYEECKAVHLNFCIMPEPTQIRRPSSTLELKGLARAHEFDRTGSAYALMHATRPSTIGFALASSPVALLAWIGEKFLTWTDTTPPLDTILESVTLYWLTGCLPTTLYPYRQLFTPGSLGIHESPLYHIPVHKPFGFSWFPREIAPVPRAWVETTADNVKFWRAHERGGHFAALEETEALLRDLEEFVKLAWPPTTAACAHGEAAVKGTERFV